MKKTLLILLAALLISLMSLSCQTERIIYKDVPPGYTIIRTDVLEDLMQSCSRAKTELLECLERERQRKE